MEHTEDGVVKIRQTLARKSGGQRMFGWVETEMAANAETARRVECPFGVSACFKDSIRVYVRICKVVAYSLGLITYDHITYRLA